MSNNNLDRLTINPVSEIFSRQKELFNSFNIASKIVSDNVLQIVANSGIQNHTEIMLTKLSQLTNVSKMIVENIIPVSSVLERITSISEIIRKNNLEVIMESTSKMQEVFNIYSSQIQNSSTVMEQFFKNTLYTVALENRQMAEVYAQSIRSLAENIKMPIITVGDIINNSNWENDIDFGEFDIAESEKEIIISETKDVIKEIFSNVAEENILNLKDLKDKNLEQKWIGIWSDYKEIHPVKSDVLTKTYNYILNILIKMFFGVIGTIIFMNMISGKVQIIESFLKTKDSANNFTISDAKKEVQNIINNEYYPIKNEIFNTYRYIDKDNVFIKENHKINGYGVKKLEKGDIVEIQYQNDSKKRYKNWIYVQYEDEEGTMYEGWINNIYTKKIK